MSRGRLTGGFVALVLTTGAILTSRLGPIAPHRSTAGLQATRAAVGPSTVPTTRVGLIHTRRMAENQLVALGPNPTVGSLRHLLEQVADSDPRLALDLAETWSRTDDERLRLDSAVVARWARSEPARAWRWSREHTAKLAVPDAPPLSAVCLQAIAASPQPQRVLDCIQSVTAGSGSLAERLSWTSEALVALVTSGHADLARSATEQWLRNDAGPIGPDALRTVALAVLAIHSAETAATWLTQLPVSAQRDPAFVAVAGEWAERQPDEALAWAQTLPVTTLRTTAEARALGVWAGRDPDAAAAWFLQHEDLADADALIPAFLDQSRLGYDHPAVALDWAALVRDDALRRRTIEATLRQWAEQDRAAAQNYLATSTLFTAEQREQLLATP